MKTIILMHNIDYWFRDSEDKKLNECDAEHIEEMIKQSCNQGELCQYDVELDKFFRGWWKITKG